ncbi:uncharacterized protein [Epargyreus clarus]|uniref:uncharacterized protein n=1 Tax=Epargyreus clarus TaxID=520877 RepID=UPI003C2F037F
MTNKCSGCGKFASVMDGAKCCKCSSVFHRQCANINSDSRVPNKWQCRGCKSKIPCASASSATPKSSSSGGMDTEFTDALIDHANRGHHSTNIDIANEMRLIREQLTTIVHEITSFRQEMSTINSNVSELSLRIGDVEKKVLRLEQNTTSSQISSADPQVEETLVELKKQLNDRDQDLFMNDVEIAGVCELKGENPLHLVTALATKIGVELDERDVVSVARAGVRRAEDSGDKPRPRPIVVRLARRAVRDQLIKAARVRRGADTAGLNLSAEPRRFYINERLTPINRHLFYKAREEGRRRGWRFVWTRNGCIFARRQPDSARYRIRSDSDILKFFGD